ncbi:MAG TPA: phosphate ABC transporter permease PstA [Acholeplasmataceae bacterium]|nr:phosphate ABC transporter permease PstA [Acholeplasmataceae bacterium]
MGKIKKRQVIDFGLKLITYLASLVSVVILGAILVYIFSYGTKLLSIDIITSDYNPKSYQLNTTVDVYTNDFSNPNIDDTYFSERFGFAVSNSETKEGKSAIRFVYIDDNSPLLSAVNAQGETIEFKEGFIFNQTMRAVLENGQTRTIFSRNGAEALVDNLDDAIRIEAAFVQQEGGGIRSSILTTLLLIVVTLTIGLPFGVLTALYLHEIAPQNKITNLLRTFIDMLTGVPSIIFGLMGAAVFIPFTTKLFGDESMQRGSVIAGALTLVVIILPVVIKATESALDVVPKEYKEGSLALGANKTQTTFRIMLPNALPGILSAALLSIGRIIGESAALIFAMGTFISDNVSLTGRSTSLSVHVWAVMGGEIPNVDLASTIAIIILAVVLILNILVKIITNKFMKRYN